VAPFSEDLQRFQDLEERYRKELVDYETEHRRYTDLLAREPQHPDLAKLYETVEEKGRRARDTYAELESLQRTRAPQSKF
jgi:uncharacterized protein YeaO (DUF488 family)